MNVQHYLRPVLASLFLVACSSSGSPQHPIDLSSSPQDLAGNTGDDLSGGPDDMAGGTMGCNGVYSKSTIAAMRQNMPGCYELDTVTTIAVTPVGASTKSVTIYAQDAAGGDYSAVKMSCSSTSTTHMCTAFPTAKSILSGRSVTVSGTYIKSSASKGGFELFYIDSISDTASATAPTPATLMEVDLERAAAMSSGSKPMAAFHYQIVTANITDKLLMFDWSAPEFKGTSGSCPQYGFGMIPTSAGASAGAACSGMTQPAGQTAVNDKEVMVGTNFYGGFTYTTDCNCGQKYMQPVPTATQGVTGSITAVLDYDVPYGSTTGYQYLNPLTNAAFMIQ
jgi:hypothetical protein